MTKACVICGGDEASGDQLLEAPCQQHWVCTDDVASFFQRATENESLYPPMCCGQLFLLDVYEAYVPFEMAWDFQMKAQGEYSVLAKYRVYCANPACSKFLNSATHVKDASTNTSYAVCQDEACGKLTCTTCKTLMDGADSHICKQNEDDKKFKQTATEKSFQECPTCASTVELAEACNHITCECGTPFCYICGEEWPGMHGCPHYGPAVYDEDGYNQDGFHRTTGLNREGLTRREQTQMNHGENGDSDDEHDDEEGEEGIGNLHPVLQHVGPDVRAAFAALPHGERDMFLVNLQIQLFEERGITFEEHGESDGDGEEDGDSSDNSSEIDEGELDHDLGQASGDEGENEVGQGNGAEQDQHANEDGPTLADITQDAIEALDAALDEALQAIENLPESAAMAAGAQIDEGSADSGDVATALAMQRVAEVEMDVVQYLTDLSRAYSGGAASDAGEDDMTATDRPMSGAELADTLQQMRADLLHGSVSRSIVQEALGILHARFPTNEEILLFQETLPYLADAERAVGDNDASSSASAVETQPLTPMDVDVVNEQQEEQRGPWKGEEWSSDEEL